MARKTEKGGKSLGRGNVQNEGRGIWQEKLKIMENEKHPKWRNLKIEKKQK
ncbi:hypothetical protein GBG65_21465 (plasmid) [Curtobacterium flaccumfaciens pv. flaccumfaciens]|nr:hypothetical protein GBG65_21465 [Curtobacterium flaccumfaciens pv. flaccumfaciens]